MRKYTERDLKKKASKAVDAFLDGGTPLSETISAMVEPDELSDHHIARICEMANHETRGRMFKDKNIDQSRVVFPAAKSVEIIKITRKPEVAMEQQKEASARYSIPDDYFQSPRQVILNANPPPSDMMQKTASAHIDVLKSKMDILDQEYQKVAYEARRDLREFGARRADFFKQAAHDLRFGVCNAEQLVAMAGAVDDGENGAYDLLDGNLDLMKEAMPIDDLKNVVDNMREFINPDLKVNYVLGDSPLLIKFKGMVGASKKVQSKARRMKELYDEYGDIEKIITQADLGGGSGSEMPKVAGLPEKKAEGAPPVKGWSAFRQGMRFGALDVPFGALEGYQQYGEDKSHFRDMANLRKDPSLASSHMQKLIERNPEQWASFQKKWGGNRWLTDTMANKAIARRDAKEHQPGDVERMPAAKAFRDMKNKIVNQELDSYDKIMKPNTVTI